MAETETSPRVTYVERLPQVRREFALYADRVEVRAHWLLGRHDRTTVRLADLTPKTAVLFIRNKLVKRSIVIGSLAVALAVVVGRPGYATWLHALAPVPWGVAAACLLVAVMSFRKTRFVRFLRANGRPGLDIGQAGSGAQQFEAFVEAVRREIRRQR